MRLAKAIRLGMCGASFIAASCLGAPAPSAPVALQPPPAEYFFGNVSFGGAVMSPSGRYLAVRLSKPGSRILLAVLDLETRQPKVIANFSDADVAHVQWVNDERLVYDVVNMAEADGDREEAPGLYAVNRDGSKFIQLANRTWRGSAPQPWNTFLLEQPGSQDSEWIYVRRPLYDDNDNYFGTRLRRLNTLTGAAEVVSEPDVEVSSFMLDAKGEPRLAMLLGDVKTVIYYLDPARKKWREIAKYNTYGSAKDSILPLGFGADGTLFVAANAGEDKASLRTFDFAANKVSKEAIVATTGYDFDGSLIVREKLLGVRITTDAEGDVWLDPAMKSLQAAIDKLLPGMINMIDLPSKPAGPWVLVESFADRQPLRYWLYDTKTGAIEGVGSTYPKIDAAQMGLQEPIAYTARDGLQIPGLLTLPPGGVRKNLPMVVLVHGGPWVRGSSWRWDPESQFLATRGYAVLEVEFRGSTGFGARHFEAGIKQWGLAMQNDIADGTRWAIAQGIADPKRICIAGSSYGGYAALMGLVNDPDLYRCGIEWAGVTDIELMYTGTWFSKSDASAGFLKYGMPVLIGDPVKDSAQLKATSPIQQAARIHQPLLLAYGEADRRVPLYHGKKFYSAVRRTNEHVELVTYDGEGHGWSLPKNRINFWTRVERFLSAHIGPSTATGAH